MEEKTIKEKIDEAVDAAWTAFAAKLGELNVSYDDCDGGIYIDANDEKKTYCFNASLIECDEFGGDK